METIKGTVSKVVFRAADDAYSVLSVQAEGHLLPVTVVGKLVGVEEGADLEVVGQWAVHAKFGRQFRVQRYETRLPESNAGLVRYLSSGAVCGIGPALAVRLVEAFGSHLFEIAEASPERLVEVPGIGAKRAARLADSLAEQRAVREMMVFLQGLGIGPGTAARIFRAWGGQALELVRSDPYRLVQDVEGIGFATADAIARQLGVEQESPSRLQAGLLHLLSEQRASGHTVAGVEELLASGERFLGADRLAVEGALRELLEAGELLPAETAGESVVGLPLLVHAEQRVADALGRLLTIAPRDVPSEYLGRALEEELTAEQREGVGLAARGPMTIITGGPGTGKTTVLRALVRVLELLGEKPHLCAPTGRAAKRVAEATAMPASTIHRLLGWRGGSFQHNRRNPLERGTVIVDEVSMLDVTLARQLFESLADGSRLVLVGDADQLPSVGPGNVLRDLIAADRVPVVRLTTIFRQAESSRIVANAHRIRQGELPLPSPAGSHEGGDFHLVPVDDPQQAQRKLLEVCCERIPRAFGFDPLREVQVLSPMHRGAVGTVALNQLLQQRLNPGAPALRRAGDELRVGDKVMQVRNDYDRDVFNGDLGIVLAVDPEEGGVSVEIDGAVAEYRSDQVGQLSLAYCVSIHKSQGSEYPAVVVPLLNQHYVLLQRNLFYTAVTRARQLVVLVASESAVRMAVSRTEQSVRRTLLCQRLQAALD